MPLEPFCWYLAWHNTSWWSLALRAWPRRLCQTHCSWFFPPESDHNDVLWIYVERHERRIQACPLFDQMSGKDFSILFPLRKVCHFHRWTDSKEINSSFSFPFPFPKSNFKINNNKTENDLLTWVFGANKCLLDRYFVIREVSSSLIGIFLRLVCNAVLKPSVSSIWFLFFIFFYYQWWNHLKVYRRLTLNNFPSLVFWIPWVNKSMRFCILSTTLIVPRAKKRTSPIFDISFFP